MTIIVGLALGLIIGGLIMCFLAGNAKFPLLTTILIWVGIALVVIGLILLLTPVLVWINMQLRSMLNL